MVHNSDSHTAKTIGWSAIFCRYDIGRHNFDTAPFPISAKQINSACQHLSLPKAVNARMLCQQNTREARPKIFQEMGLFLLPIKTGQYVIVKGEGYVDIPSIESPLIEYRSDFPFQLETTLTGNSEMQYLDLAYALSLIRHFTGDDSLVLTIRGGKYALGFDFRACGFSLSVESVQTEVDGGYEGEKQVVLVEAKNTRTHNTIIRQIYYPFRQWQTHTSKSVSTLFFQRTNNGEYHIWHFGFDDPNDYSSIQLLKSARYTIALNAG